MYIKYKDMTNMREKMVIICSVFVCNKQQMECALSKGFPCFSVRVHGLHKVGAFIRRMPTP